VVLSLKFFLPNLAPGSSYDRLIGAFIIQQSTGRGGAGNFRSPSKEPQLGLGPDDYSDTRGRDPIPATDPYVVCDLLLLSSLTYTHAIWNF
jgi:hypothetical protein